MNLGGPSTRVCDEVSCLEQRMLRALAHRQQADNKIAVHVVTPHLQKSRKNTHPPCLKKAGSVVENHSHP